MRTTGSANAREHTEKEEARLPAGLFTMSGSCALRSPGRARCGRRHRTRGLRRLARDVDACELRGVTHRVVELRVDLLHAVPREQRLERGLAGVGLAVVDEAL